MNLRSKRSQPSIKLPYVLAIGFTGHRNLLHEPISREAIRLVLSDWKSKVKGIVYGVSSAAAGGDLLFAETCIELDIPVRILLPFAKEQFRNDFDDPTWNRAERVFAKAFSVEILGVSGPPEELYYECGIETVQQSHLLIALWDGGPSQGMGGTADIVHFAREQGRTVLWIESANGAVQSVNENELLLRDPEMEFLNGLPDPVGIACETTPHGLTKAWFHKVDQNASRVAPQFRRLAAIPILCTAAAALFSGRSSLTGGAVIWLWLGTALAILAAVLPTLMRLTRRQIVWTRMRTASEICRSCLALWSTPTPYNVVGQETVPELSGMLTSLNYLKMSDRASPQFSLDEFKRDYRENRIGDQLAYFSRHADHSETQIKRYRIVTWASVGIAVGFNFWLLLNAHGLNHWISASAKPLLAMAATTLFQIATVAGALLVVNDFQRRRDRYRELHRMLTQRDKQLGLAQTWPIALRIISVVEKALLAELIEWRSHIRNRKVPQK